MLSRQQMQQSGGQGRGLTGDIYKSRLRWPRGDVYIYEKALDCSGRSAEEKEKRTQD